jgi:DNA-binding transcriptional ArsR family regulator
LYKRLLELMPMVDQAEAVNGALRALSDGNRRRILALVRDQPRSVGEIARQLDVSQQIASHHLGVLRRAGLVSERRERTRHLFVVSTDGLAAVRDFLDQFWPTQLAALKRAAEAEAGRNAARGPEDA